MKKLNGSYLDVGEVAKRTGKSERTVRKWLLTGLLPGEKLEGWYIEEKVLKDFDLPKIGRPPEKPTGHTCPYCDEPIMDNEDVTGASNRLYHLDCAQRKIEDERQVVAGQP